MTPEPSERLHSSHGTDPDLVELVRMFVDEMPARIAALQAAWEAEELSVVRRLAHQLAGASAGYGFDPVGDAARKLEARLTDRGPAETIRREFDDLVSLCSKVTV
ncbi:MAG: Hpt domain-containing protein [Phycisphaerae bacterium]|nr:Hpt domain-containing protein [Phycisphaerae bacterium]